MSIRENSAYLKALSSLSTWDNPPEGLVFPSSESTGEKIQKLIKQNNFIISLLIQQSERINSLEAKVTTVPLPKEQPDLDNLVERLSALSLGTDERKIPARKEAPFYVVKDPKAIWKEEKSKLDGAKSS